MAQEGDCDASLFIYASRGQQVYIGELVIATLKILGLDETLFHQRLEAIVGFAKADAKLPRQLPLSELRVFLDQTHDAEVDFVFAHEQNQSVSDTHVQSMNASIDNVPGVTQPKAIAEE